MSESFIGEIRMFAGNFAPAGWAFCDGSLVAISENDALFSLIGTTYGGDGQTTFALPDLRGRLPMHQGNGAVIGESGGAESVTITPSTMAAHTHTLSASGNPGGQSTAASNVLSQSPSIAFYKAPPFPIALAPQALPGVAGGSQPHDNFQPYLCLNFIISLFGIYPSRP
jgi:microcystin-dependent protein